MTRIKVKQFLQKNWFKLLLVGFIIFLMFKKDISFQINMKSPLQERESKYEDQIPVQQPARKQSSERYTENRRVSQQASGQQSDLFKLYPSGGGIAPPQLVLAFNKIDRDSKTAFIRRFGHVAISERKKFGLPASIILANGLLLSRAGSDEVSQTGHNFFDLPCTDDWLGEQGYHGGKCLRYYENAWTSFRDHSLYLTTGSNSKLKSLGSSNYQAWAEALQESGFYPEPHTAKYIVSIIEQFELSQFDID